MEANLQSFQYAALDLLHLVHGQLVAHDDFYRRIFQNGWIHILHAGGNTAQVLRHAVAHGQPFHFQFVLCELMFFLILRVAFLVVWSCVFDKWPFAVVADVVPRVGDAAQFEFGRTRGFCRLP